MGFAAAWPAVIRTAPLKNAVEFSCTDAVKNTQLGCIKASGRGRQGETPRRAGIGNHRAVARKIFAVLITGVSGRYGNERVRREIQLLSLNAALDLGAVELCAASGIGGEEAAAPEWVHLLPADEIRTSDGRGPY
jgi:hypothetical protein